MWTEHGDNINDMVDEQDWRHRRRRRGKSLQGVQFGCDGQKLADQGCVVGGGSGKAQKEGGGEGSTKGAERTRKVWAVKEGLTRRRRKERGRQRETASSFKPQEVLGKGGGTGKRKEGLLEHSNEEANRA